MRSLGRRPGAAVVRAARGAYLNSLFPQGFWRLNPPKVALTDPHVLAKTRNPGGSLHRGLVLTTEPLVTFDPLKDHLVLRMETPSGTSETGAKVAQRRR
jgi:hypothetical protein